MEMMQLINEVLKPQEHSLKHENAVAMPPVVAVQSLESDHQCDANVSPTDPQALNEHGRGRHNRHVNDQRVKELRKKQLAEWPSSRSISRIPGDSSSSQHSVTADILVTELFCPATHSSFEKCRRAQRAAAA
ncbi:hypothetical protein ACLKA6_015889 [Drosophila palustris]